LAKSNWKKIGSVTARANRWGTPLYVGFSEMPLVSISNAHRSRIANANFVAPDGNPVHLPKPNCNRSEYVAFLGRISPEKRPDRAFRIIRLLPTNIYEQQSLLPERHRQAFASACKSCASRPSGQPIDLNQKSLLPERPPPGFRKCVQVVRESAEWPTKLIQVKSAHLGAE
jgi:hypothetical protein